MEYHLINNFSSFQEALTSIRESKRIFLDLEFDKNHFRYGFNLCLMQLFDGEKCYLIDPLSDINIADIFPILEDESIEIVTFAFSEDLRLFHSLGCFPNRIIDISTAVRLLSLPPISLENLLLDRLNIPAKKSQQKSNWFERPLKEEQLIYAAEDVIYLPELWDLISKELEKENRTSWLLEEIAFLETQNWQQEESTVEVPSKEMKYFTKQEWMRYSALFLYRDEKAKKLNRPSFKVIDKSILEKLARKEIIPQQILEEKRIHPALKTSKIEKEIDALLSRTEEEIKSKNIAPNAPSRTPLEGQEKLELRKKRSWVNHTKSNILLPVKNWLINQYGEHLANFILSNRKMDGLLYGNVFLLDYQKRIVTEAADNLKINDLNQYLETKNK